MDVRGLGEHKERNIPGSMQMAHTRIAARKSELPLRKLIVHCETGRRAAYAVSYLERIGMDPIYCDGSFDDWVEFDDTGNLPNHNEVKKSDGSIAS